MRNSFAAIVLFVMAPPAFAHRLHVDPKIVGNQLRVEAYYDDDTPAQEARITIVTDDQTVAEGRTDEKGVWTCACPKPGKYMVKAESVGHAAKEPLEVFELGIPAVESPPDERKRQTQTPWARLTAGLGLIGGLYVAWLIARRSLGKARSDLEC